ncbi:hypothetical protein ACFLZ2_01130 [Candidatus Margulisiibacteriota bacterium]
MVKRLVILLVMMIGVSSMALAAASANYQISAEVFEFTGGTYESSSTNYIMLGKARPHKPEISDSTNYSIKGGFVAAVLTGATVEGAPIVTSITPESWYNDSAVSLEITGSNISTDATAALTRTGYSQINGYNYTYTSSTEIIAYFDVTSRTPGLWNVAVTNQGTKTGVLYNAFNLIESGPARLVGTASNEPNPFDPRTGPTNIKFNLSAPSTITLYLFSQTGEMVWKERINGVRGDNSVPWDAKSDFGESVPTGVYICRIIATGAGGTRELAKVKIAVLRR